MPSMCGVLGSNPRAAKLTNGTSEDKGEALRRWSGDPGAQTASPYLPSLFTNGPTRRDPRKPPNGNMDTVTDHSRVRETDSRNSPVRLWWVSL